MMLYVNEGLKNTACNPTFTQVRDGIIQAAMDLHGGEDVCPIWEAFLRQSLPAGTASTSVMTTTAIPTSAVFLTHVRYCVSWRRKE